MIVIKKNHFLKIKDVNGGCLSLCQTDVSRGAYGKHNFSASEWESGTAGVLGPVQTAQPAALLY